MKRKNTKIKMVTMMPQNSIIWVKLGKSKILCEAIFWPREKRWLGEIWPRSLISRIWLRTRKSSAINFRRDEPRLSRGKSSVLGENCLWCQFTRGDIHGLRNNGPNFGRISTVQATISARSSFTRRKMTKIAWSSVTANKGSPL